MTTRSTRFNLQKITEISIALAVLSLLLAYSYARFFVMPYSGFQFNSSSGRVDDLFVENSPPSLQLGDWLVSVDGRSFAEYRGQLGINLLEGLAPGEEVQIQVERTTGPATILWKVPGFNMPEFFGRLINAWVLSYIFWIAGTATLALVRPKDLRWGLLVAFFYINATWLMAGSFSSSGLWFSQYVLRAAIWIGIPIFLQLHANFPRVTKPGSSRWWLGLYAICLIFAGLQLVHGVPNSLYFVAFGISVLGSAAILLYRVLFDKTVRRELSVLLVSFVVAFAPALVLAALSYRSSAPTQIGGLIFSVVIFPGAYFYVVYRRQLGGAELRANRAISFYLFLVVLVTLFLVLAPLFSSQFASLSGAGAIILATGILTALASVFGFARFERFVERHLLRIPQPPDHLLAAFAGRISTSFTNEHLANILQKEVLPTLLIRQSALLNLGSDGNAAKTVYLQGLTPKQLPNRKQQQAILSAAKEKPENVGLASGLDWLQVAIPLLVAQHPVGLWLLGRKDPDDVYSFAEQSLLRSLADQMAIALANIAQAQNLRTLYQIDVERQEDERSHLARELHDDILNELNMLLSQAEQTVEDAPFQAKHKSLNDRIRRLINGLRPPMLNYGLYQAFSQLADELAAKADGVELSLSVAASEVRYDHKVEEHVYRVVQQAAENALEHGKAQYVSISGRLEPGAIEILVEDDGVGFRLDGTDLSYLLETKHFGLASMSERAALIGATLDISSTPRRGTRVGLHWPSSV